MKQTNLLLQALKEIPRERIQVATKFGVMHAATSGIVVKGTPDYVRTCCLASLQRLGVDYIDLYYQHRVDQTIPIEHTVEYSTLFEPYLFVYLFFEFLCVYLFK